MPGYFDNYPMYNNSYSQQPPMQSQMTPQMYSYPTGGYTDSYSRIGARQSINPTQPMYGQNPPQQTQQQSNQAVHVLPVTCREEAIASPIPLDGSITYFPDRAHKMVYSKQFNLNDGSAIIHEYYEDSIIKGQNAQQPKQEAQEQAQQQEQVKSVAYVEKGEFEALQGRIKELEEKLQSLSASAQEAQKKQKGDK